MSHQLNGPEQPLVQDENEILDYTVDWTDQLDGDTIASVEWADPSPSGLTLGSGARQPTNTATHTTIWLSAGQGGTQYRIEATITTAAVPPRIIQGHLLVTVRS